jgi:hypothetical protein
LFAFDHLRGQIIHRATKGGTPGRSVVYRPAEVSNFDLSLKDRRKKCKNKRSFIS